MKTVDGSAVLSGSNAFAVFTLERKLVTGWALNHFLMPKSQLPEGLTFYGPKRKEHEGLKRFLVTGLLLALLAATLGSIWPVLKLATVALFFLSAYRLLRSYSHPKGAQLLELVNNPQVYPLTTSWVGNNYRHRVEEPELELAEYMDYYVAEVVAHYKKEGAVPTDPLKAILMEEEIRATLLENWERIAR